MSGAVLTPLLCSPVTNRRTTPRQHHLHFINDSSEIAFSLGSKPDRMNFARISKIKSLDTAEDVLYTKLAVYSLSSINV